MPRRKGKLKTSVPWITTELKTLGNRASRLYRNYKITNQDDDLAKYKSATREYRQQFRLAKKSFEESLIKDRSLSKFFDYANNRFKSRCAIPTLVDNNLCYDKDIDKVDIFKNQFSAQYNNQTYDYERKFRPLNGCLQNAVFSPDSVFLSLNSLRKKSAGGPDHIPAILVKKFASVLSFTIAAFFNISIASGEIPLIWKHANLTPNYRRNGDASSPSNY